jgi:putative PIN family toxin of toxin-antitoxin system
VKLVLDTNVLISSLLSKGTPPDQLYRAWEAGRFELCTSSRQVAEIRRVLGYEKLQAFIKPLEAALLLENMDSMAHLIEVTAARTESPDPDDNWILATAVDAEAEFLVTGDKNHLLALRQIEGVRIVTAREALNRL